MKTQVADNNTERKEVAIEEVEKQIKFIKLVREIVDEKKNKLGRDLTASVITFGCQMNERDSEKLKGILIECGYRLVDDEEGSDFTLYNTCTVRENANMRLYGRLGALNKTKKTNAEKIIGVCGCMAQEPDVVEKLEKSYGFVDVIFGTFNVYKLAEILYARLTSGTRIIDIWESNENFVELLPTERKYSFKSGVNIMYGCDNFCTYCIVPYVRGREKSRRPEDIVEEIRRLVDNGVVEVMLLGQNVNSYGKGLEGDITFAKLLKEVEKIEGLRRIRFMTPHPKDLSDELIDVCSQSEKICKHIHLPVQSGSSRILKSMNRHYTKESYLDLVNKIRKKIPGVSITTDIIVGFPGETEEDFEETLDVVRRAEYDSAFTFIYSKRTGTPAANMDNIPEKSVVDKRFNRLLEEVRKGSKARSGHLIGQTLEVLAEGVNDHDPSLLSGRLSNNMLVHFPGDESMIGQIIPVEIEESKGFYYFGKRKD